jgi:hypothetical protein
MVFCYTGKVVSETDRKMFAKQGLSLCSLEGLKLNDKLSEKAAAKVIDAFGKIKDDLQEKAEAKRWKKIHHPFTLTDALNRLTKAHLDDLRRQLDIQGASSLKKAELILVLKDEILAGLKDMCSKLDNGRFSLLSELVSNNGVVEAPSLEDYQYTYFNDSSIAMTGSIEGRKVLVMPKEIASGIAALQDNGIQAVIERNTEYIKLTQGLLYYYGAIPYPPLKELLDKHLNVFVSGSDYLPVMLHAAAYYKDIVLEENYISSAKVPHPEKVLQEHQMRSNVPYNSFTKSQLFKAGEPGFVERNQSYTQFVYYLNTRFEMTKEEADSIARECANTARFSEDMHEVMKYLESMLEVDSMEAVQELADRVVILWNNTRKWDLKGYAPIELREKTKVKTGKVLSIQSKQKLSRNEPCPCGSGKKYKKCCGK